MRDHDMSFELKKNRIRINTVATFTKRSPRHNPVTPEGHPKGTELKIWRRHKGGERRKEK
jgi:hypothetical protein